MASTKTYELLWADPDWHAEARAWIEDPLAADGRKVAGELEQPQLMQWATALRVPTSDGVAWFDLHDANIFVRGDEYRIIDWGDSCVAHPFHSPAVALAVVEHRLGADAVEPIRAAYVDAWAVAASPEQLEAAFRLGYVSGTLKWHEVRNLVPDKTRDGFDDGLPLRLRKVLELCA